MTVGGVPYLVDEEEPAGVSMVDCLSEILDPFTIGRLDGVGVPTGGRCWEVGAGNGSVATWLAGRVGPTGEVIATDPEPERVRVHPLVTVLRRDDETGPLPQGEFDVIHARLAFARWPSRTRMLSRFVRSLRPGGVLVLEDWGRWVGPLLCSPVPGAAGLYARYQAALRVVLDGLGDDADWALSMAGEMVGAGLVEVDTQVFTRSWAGGTAGCLLPIAVAAELRTPLLHAGATIDDLDALPALLHHPETLILGNATVSTIGRRPHR
nr:class I SAM-dependent methyltransferase [Micromonospora sp. DSM 115978]